MKKIFTKDEKKKAIELYKSGLGYFKVSKIIGCDPRTVKRWIEKESVEKHPPLDHGDQTRKDIIDYYVKNDFSITDIAYIFGIPGRTIERWIYKAKVAKGRKILYDRKQILKDIETMSQADVANKHGCSESLVSRIKNGKL